MDKKNIYIVGAHPGGNKGAEAMLDCVVTSLLQIPALIDEYDIFLEKINNSTEYETFANNKNLGFKFFYFKPRSFSAAYEIDLSAQDILIDISGITYNDNSLLSNIRTYRRHSFFASRECKKIFFTQDFGPVRRWTSRFLARKAFLNADVVFARSKVSKEMLEANVPGINVIGPFPDCTLALVPVGKSDFQKFGGKYIVLSPSAIMYNKHENDYLELFKKVAMQFPEDYEIVIMPHCLTRNGSSSDSEVCRMIYEKLSSERQSHLCTDSLSAAELKGVLSSAKAVVTSRFHAMVGALSSEVPSYAIGWNHKYDEFLAQYGMEEFSRKMPDSELPHDDAEEWAKNIVDLLLNHADSSRIALTNKSLRAEVEKSFSLLREYVLG